MPFVDRTTLTGGSSITANSLFFPLPLPSHRGKSRQFFLQMLFFAQLQILGNNFLHNNLVEEGQGKRRREGSVLKSFEARLTTDVLQAMGMQHFGLHEQMAAHHNLDAKAHFDRYSLHQ